MKRNDIIRIAQEAGLHIATDVKWMPIIGLEYAEKFAALVASAEREACAKLCDDHCGWTPRMIGSTIRARGQA